MLNRYNLIVRCPSVQISERLQQLQEEVAIRQASLNPILGFCFKPSSWEYAASKVAKRQLHEFVQQIKLINDVGNGLRDYRLTGKNQFSVTTFCDENLNSQFYTLPESLRKVFTELGIESQVQEGQTHGYAQEGIPFSRDYELKLTIVDEQYLDAQSALNPFVGPYADNLFEYFNEQIEKALKTHKDKDKVRIA